MDGRHALLLSWGLVRLPGAVCSVLVAVGCTHGYELERLPGAWCRETAFPLSHRERGHGGIGESRDGGGEVRAAE